MIPASAVLEQLDTPRGMSYNQYWVHAANSEVQSSQAGADRLQHTRKLLMQQQTTIIGGASLIMLQQQETVLGKELAETKVDDIAATSAGRGGAAREILENYRLPHRKVTFASARTVPTGPNPLHNSDRSEVIPWPKSNSSSLFFLTTVLKSSDQDKTKKCFDPTQSPKFGAWRRSLVYIAGEQQQQIWSLGGGGSDYQFLDWEKKKKKQANFIRRLQLLLPRDLKSTSKAMCCGERVLWTLTCGGERDHVLLCEPWQMKLGSRDHHVLQCEPWPKLGRDRHVQMLWISWWQFASAAAMMVVIAMNPKTLNPRNILGSFVCSSDFEQDWFLSAAAAALE